MLQRVLVRKFGGLAHIRSRVFPGETSIGPSPPHYFTIDYSCTRCCGGPFTLHPICPLQRNPQCRQTRKFGPELPGGRSQ